MPINGPTKTKVKVGIIIVSYQRYDVTNLALDSIAKAKCKVPYSIFLIDNQSSPTSFARIKSVFDYLVNCGKFTGKIIRNEKNLGFAGGNNIGIRLALEDPEITHICLLNNDTVVTDEWLDGLVAHAENGLVGPVTNSVGNEQLVPVSYIAAGTDGYTRQVVNEYAVNWRKSRSGHVVSTKMLGFFCVLGPKKLFEQVGLLDEAFGIGYYEDDDFCFRCLQSGFTLKIVRDVFIHHWGSASFNSLGSEKINALFKKNKAIFEKKHGTKWAPPSDSWALSFAHELESIIKSKPAAFDLEKLNKIASLWIQSVRNEAFRTCSDVNFIPGGIFSAYVRDGILLRLRNNSWPMPWKIPHLIKTVFFLVRDTIFSIVWRKIRSAIDRPRVLCIQFIKKTQPLILTLKRLVKVILPSESEAQFATIILPIQSFFGRRQRPQHIAAGLAKSGHKVFWIEPQLDPAIVAKQKWKGLYLLEAREKNNLKIIGTSCYDFSNFYVSGWSGNEASEFLIDLEDYLLVRFGVSLKNCKLIIESPFWANCARLFHGVTIYECMDAHNCFGSATEEVTMLDDILVSSCDAVVVSSNYLQEKFRCDPKFRKPIYLINNACDPAHFISTSRKEDGKQKTDTPIIGYFGAVAEWFDVELLSATAEALPGYKFEIIGNTERSSLDENKLPKNIKIMGEKDYHLLPYLTSNWRAAMIPFKLTELILATNPVKLYEYSALGLPIIATAIPEVKKATIDIYFGTDAATFSAGIKKAISEDSKEKREARRMFATSNSWEKKISLLREVLLQTRKNGETGNSISPLCEGLTRKDNITSFLNAPFLDE